MGNEERINRNIKAGGGGYAGGKAFFEGTNHIKEWGEGVENRRGGRVLGKHQWSSDGERFREKEGGN